jgi:SAM-dependent methyltransferase
MEYTVNSTKDYHVKQLNSLGWELTVCNALYPENTPLRKLLRNNNSFGHLLYDYLSNLLPMEKMKRILEIGGGYGYLMKGFLNSNNALETYMLDISPYLIEKQKETLKDHHISYRLEDFLQTAPAFLEGFDLAIMNENLGDFPTLINLNAEIFRLLPDVLDPNLKKVLSFFERYALDRPTEETFHFNAGALEAVEKLCASNTPWIFLSEHSCEATVPEPLRPFVRIQSAGNPERISLMGHDEYSIKFSYLQQMAHVFGYKSLRGPFADFISLDFTEELRYITASQGQHSDEDEIVCHFIEDLYKYEYLLLIKEPL